MSWISNLRPETAWVIPAVAGVILAIVGTVLHFMRENRRAELEAETEQESLALKRAMVERGMSAAEIEQVVSAGRPNDVDASKS